MKNDTTPFLIPDDGDEKAIKEYCLDHVIPSEFWGVNYSDGLHDDLRRKGYNLKLPANIGQIKFAELIRRLDHELWECSSSGLYELQAAEEQGLACVRLVAWLLANRRL